MTKERKETIIGFLSAIAITVLLVLECNHADAQMKLNVGIGKGSHYFSQADIGYKMSHFDVQFNAVRNIVQPPFIFGVSGGYSWKFLRVYAGGYRKLTGNKSSVDRYVENGQTQILFKGIDTNAWLLGGGLQLKYRRGILDIAHKDGLKISLLLSVLDKD